MSAVAPGAATYFATAAAFRRWLTRHHESSTELLVGFHKVHSSEPSITWPEAVDQALCFGWIDGIRRRIDADRYSIRFTPRRPRSIWSAVNIRRVEALSAEGLMRPVGMAAFARRSEARSSTYAYEQREPASFTACDLRTFKRAKGAWQYFQAQPPWLRRRSMHWVTSAKREATRDRRLAELIGTCERGEDLR